MSIALKGLWGHGEWGGSAQALTIKSISFESNAIKLDFFKHF